ncbi:hypothetical protein AVEN_188588-1 [Araneus ventricosus]|uniref:Uncharacterized protein n=1 Tax=Araneus ventricosus TaxID=182803 RepID=A0A4Y2HQU2_ARAVE|nr:hypothetical protein AVEN_188588-1 [Araneus ventricosus]
MAGTFFRKSFLFLIVLQKSSQAIPILILHVIKPLTVDSFIKPLSSVHALFIKENTLSTGADVPGGVQNRLNYPLPPDFLTFHQDRTCSSRGRFGLPRN